MTIVTETGLIHVFAYGSNLCTRRIAARVDDLQLVCVGSIAGYALRFNKRSRDGSAKANAHRTAVIDDVVWGAVYGMDAVNKKRLDSFEGLGQDYFESEVAVQTTAGASIAALFYWANPEHVDEGGRPLRLVSPFLSRRGARTRISAGLLVPLGEHASDSRPRSRSPCARKCDS